MSKQDRNFKGTVQKQEAPEIATRVSECIAPTKRQPKGKQRKCPICYEGLGGGIGRTNGRYKKCQTLNTRYFECDTCGYTWTKKFIPERYVDEDGIPDTQE